MSRSKHPSLFFLSILVMLLSGCSDRTDPSQTVEPSATDKALQQVRDLVDKARDADPGDAVDWATEDIKKIGDFEYKIITIPDLSNATIEERLNELGEERWEVYWMDKSGNELRFFLKRSAKSYLRAIPLSEIGKALSPDGQ